MIQEILKKLLKGGNKMTMRPEIKQKEIRGIRTVSWKAFKEKVEKEGVTDDMVIGMIDLTGFMDDVEQLNISITHKSFSIYC